MKSVKITPISMVDKHNMQRVRVDTVSDNVEKITLEAVDAESGKTVCGSEFKINAGEYFTFISLPAPEKDIRVKWKTYDGSNTVLSKPVIWESPRKWTFYIMVSSHTDIGLHNPPYVQRLNCAKTLEAAERLCDETSERNPEDRFRYVMEGTWVLDCVAGESGTKKAKELVDNYVKKGSIGICGGLAGNHTQCFGLEETVRAANERKRLKDEWEIDTKTVAFIDVNGMSWGIVQPYADAGYENVIFSPNHWNPLRSTVWQMNDAMPYEELNPEAGGGGARMDMRFGSALPRVFFWKPAHGDKPLLVFSGGMYSTSGVLYGFSYTTYPDIYATRRMEAHFSETLPEMDKSVPYDIWIMPCYNDDQVPDLKLTDCLKLWNEKWSWPKLRTLGNPDEPFNILRERFGDIIPTVSGDITGGWYQHPVAAPDYLANKFEADRLLATAEKAGTFAALTDSKYLYPAEKFNRAWKALLCHDEHSYGTSGYQGRRVYDTWIQHRDWIISAADTAKKELERAMKTLSAAVKTDSQSVIAFNPVAEDIVTKVEFEGKISNPVTLPSMGLKRIPLSEMKNKRVYTRSCSAPPTAENEYYRVVFSSSGGIAGIYDKSLGRELIRQGSEANVFMWTQDNHSTFSSPSAARFEIKTSDFETEVVSYSTEEYSGAELVQKVKLVKGERTVYIDNSVRHVRGLYNNKRYYRYAYFAFPFSVDNPKRICFLNGCEAEYGKDVTGHGTDVYMAAGEWVCEENGEFGIGVIQWDSQLVEFGKIHPDKTDFGFLDGGSDMYFYLANDWLQMHSAGGSHMNYRFRYAITSFEGNHKTARFEKTAEKLLNPPVTTLAEARNGKINGEISFLNCQTRVLSVRPAKDGNGIVCSLYGDNPSMPEPNPKIFGITKKEWNTVSEEPQRAAPCGGFASVRIKGSKLKINREPLREYPDGAANKAVGSVYTGLIQRPLAARGEDDGHLYLQWGAVYDEDLKGYELFRGESASFEPSEENFVALVEPEEYCVGRYSDKGLEHHKRYFYRVRTVDINGNHGEFSEVFDAWTKE